MTGPSLAQYAPMVAQPLRGSAAETDGKRLRAVVVENFDPVWRFLRRLGLAPADVDDATQEVMMVVAQKLSSIDPGSERAFMFGTAYHMAMRVRRARGRRQEVGEESFEGHVDPGLGPEDLSDRRRARRILDQVLEELPVEQRAVFVLAEIDELTTGQIAELLSVPPGTVASRLRRARESFHAALSRMHAQQRFRGGAS